MRHPPFSPSVWVVYTNLIGPRWRGLHPLPTYRMSYFSCVKCYRICLVCICWRVLLKPIVDIGLMYHFASMMPMCHVMRSKTCLWWGCITSSLELGPSPLSMLFNLFQCLFSLSSDLVDNMYMLRMLTAVSMHVSMSGMDTTVPMAWICGMWRGMLVGGTMAWALIVVAEVETTQDFGTTHGGWVKIQWNESAVHHMRRSWEDVGRT